MFCRNCGAQISEQVSFCPYCGDKKGSNEAANQQEAAYTDNISVPVQQTENTQACGNDYVPQEPYAQPQEQLAAPVVGKKKRKKAPLIILAVIVVVAAVGGILYATGALNPLLAKIGITSPVYEVFEAAKKTLFESESATFELSGDGTDYKLQVSFGDGVDSIKAYLEDDGEGLFGIYDGEVYTYHNGVSGIDSVLGNMETEADKLIDGKINEESLEKFYNDTLCESFESIIKVQYLENLSYEEQEKYMNEEGYIDFDKIPVDVDIPDYDTIMSVLKEFFTKGLTEKAIETEKDGDTYRYTINVGDFLDALADFAKENETVSKLISDICNALDEDEDYIYEEIKESAEEASEENIRISGKVKIEDGYLTYVDASAGGEDLFCLSVSEINGTTVDKDDVESIETEYPYDYGYDYY